MARTRIFAGLLLLAACSLSFAQNPTEDSKVEIWQCQIPTNKPDGERLVFVLKSLFGGRVRITNLSSEKSSTGRMDGKSANVDLAAFGQTITRLTRTADDSMRLLLDKDGVVQSTTATRLKRAWFCGRHYPVHVAIDEKEKAALEKDKKCSWWTLLEDKDWHP